MSIDFPLRESATRLRQQADLEKVLKDWKAVAETEFPQHGSQILAAHSTLAAILTRVTDTVNPLPFDKFTFLVLSAHRIWDYYQSKFSQRRLINTADFFEAADQLAFDCYAPAASLQKKSPPLIILSGASTPYVQKRDSPFAVESVATQQGLAAGAAEALKHLPFPVIGLPWYQRAQLEGLVAIGHEVGHAVEDDLSLTAGLQTLFGLSVAPQRAAIWKSWQRELFADTWGCLSCGPAFAYSLADFLAPTDRWLAPVVPNSTYPPAWLRLRFLAAILKTLKMDAPAMADWVDSYPSKPDDELYLHDLDSLAIAVVAFRLPAPDGRTLAGIALSPADCRNAASLAAGWTSPAPPPPVDNPNMRITAAAIRLAYESKPDFDLHVVAAAALNRAVRKGFRDGGPSLQAADAARANTLVHFLTGE